MSTPVRCFSCSSRADSKNARPAALEAQYAAWSGIPR